MFQVALYFRRMQQLVDALSFGEALVDAETDIRREFKIDAVRQFGAQEFLVPFECSNDLVGIAAAERHDVNGGEPQIGSHAHFRHGDQVTLDDRIMHVTARQHFGERVAHQFADTQLTLRASAWRACVAMMFLLVPYRFRTFSSSWPGLSRPSTSSLRKASQCVDARDKPGHDSGNGGVFLTYAVRLGLTASVESAPPGSIRSRRLAACPGSSRRPCRIPCRRRLRARHP